MACEHQFLRAHPVTGKRLFGLLETMASRLNHFVMDNPWVPCRFGDLVAAIRQHPHSLIGLEREIGDHELRKLKALCDQHFDFYAPLYEPLRIRVTQLVKYRAELTALLQPSPSLIASFLAANSTSRENGQEIAAQYGSDLEAFFRGQERISRTVLRQLEEDDGHKLFSQRFHKVLSPKPLLALQCLPGDMESFWVEMLQRPVQNAAMQCATLAASSQPRRT